MKLNVGDTVKVKSKAFSGSVIVEDASKSDVIMRKINSFSKQTTWALDF